MDGDDCQQRLVLSVLSQDENSLDPWLIRVSSFLGPWHHAF